LPHALTYPTRCAKLAVDLSRFEHLESQIEVRWQF
jgi:hypothetical protein